MARRWTILVAGLFFVSAGMVGCGPDDPPAGGGDAADGTSDAMAVDAGETGSNSGGDAGDVGETGTTLDAGGDADGGPIRHPAPQVWYLPQTRSGRSSTWSTPTRSSC